MGAGVGSGKGDAKMVGETGVRRTRTGENRSRREIQDAGRNRMSQHVVVENGVRSNRGAGAGGVVCG